MLHLLRNKLSCSILFAALAAFPVVAQEKKPDYSRENLQRFVAAIPEEPPLVDEPAFVDEGFFGVEPLGGLTPAAPSGPRGRRRRCISWT